MPPAIVRYSNDPASTVDLTALTPSRFILQRERALPYRDSEGRVNLELVRLSLAQARSKDEIDDDVVKRLEKWERHAQKSLGSSGPAPSPLRSPRHATPISGVGPLLPRRAWEPPSGTGRPQLSRRLTMDEGDNEDHEDELPLSLRKPQRRGRADVDDGLTKDDLSSPVKRPRVGDSRDRSPIRPSPQRRSNSQPLSPIVTYTIANRELHPRQADPYTCVPIGKQTSSESGSDDVYEVQEILQESERGFLIRWAGYSALHDSWEPEANVSETLIADFRLRQAEATRYAGCDYLRNGSEKRLWCRACRQHAHPDNFSTHMRSMPEKRRTCLKHHGDTSTPTPPRSIVPTTLTEEQLARCRKFGFASW